MSCDDPKFLELASQPPPRAAVPDRFKHACGPLKLIQQSHRDVTLRCIDCGKVSVHSTGSKTGKMILHRQRAA